MKNTLKVTTPSDREIVMTRTFDAPRHLVWEAMSKPELIKRWLFGPPGWTMTVCDDDCRVGGTFRWAWSGPDGVGMAMSGKYTEVVPPERVVRTESFEFGCAPQAGEQIAKIESLRERGKDLPHPHGALPVKGSPRRRSRVRNGTRRGGRLRPARRDAREIAPLTLGPSRASLHPSDNKRSRPSVSYCNLNEDTHGRETEILRGLPCRSKRSTARCARKNPPDHSCDRTESGRGRQLWPGSVCSRRKADRGTGCGANHCAYYPMSGSIVEALKDDLKSYETSKGAIRFLAEKPLPAALVRKLVKRGSRRSRPMVRLRRSHARLSRRQTPKSLRSYAI